MCLFPVAIQIYTQYDTNDHMVVVESSYPPPYPPVTLYIHLHFWRIFLEYSQSVPQLDLFVLVGLMIRPVRTTC